MDIAEEVKEDKSAEPKPPSGPSRLQRMLDAIERAGNKVPHPALIFVALSALVVLVSAVVAWAGANVTYESINPETHEVET